MQIISTYIVNLPSRKERKEHILSEFMGKDEFDIQLVHPIPHEIPSMSLWKTFIHCVNRELKKNSPFFLFCEDDHKFINEYDYVKLSRFINLAKKLKAELLLGGVSWMKHPIQVNTNLFWVQQFNATQFTVVFNCLYERIISSNQDSSVILDFHLSKIAANKFVCFPPISSQKDFGYSDVTTKNGISGRVELLFENTNIKMNLLHKVKNTLKTYGQDALKRKYPKHISIPTYIIAKSIKDKIIKQWSNYSMFETHLIYCENMSDREEWNIINRIMVNALSNDNNELLLLVRIGHEFSLAFKQDIFIQQILDSFYEQADILLGTADGFNHAIPLSNGRYWIDSSTYMPFIIIFRTAYNKIISKTFDNEIDIANCLSKTLTNKLVIYPFILQESGENKFSMKGSMLAQRRLKMYENVCKIMADAEKPETE